MALIITLPQAVTGDLEFPTITKWGLNISPVAESYFDRMDAAGHIWTSPQIGAWKAFVSAGETDGWLEHIISCYPMFGTTGAQARIPFVSPLTSNALLKAVSGSDWDAAFLTVNGLRRGIKGSLAGLAAVDPLTLQQAITKSAAFANQNTNTQGRIYIIRNNGTKGNFYVGGSGRQSPDGVVDYNGYSRSQTPFTVYERWVMHTNVGSSAVRGDENSVDYSSYGVAANKRYAYYGTEASASWVETSASPSAVTALNPTLIEHGVNCLRYNSSGESFSTFAGAETSVTEWAQLDDGSLDTESMQSSMRAAIAALRSALYS